MRNNKNNMSLNVRDITLNHKILTFSLQNLTSFYRNITSHLTEREKIIILSSSILIFSLLNIINTFTYAPNTSALNYQSSTDIGFTFNPTISLSISPDNLTISNLTPGTALDSNTITINVATNTAYGYNLTANVGSNTTNYNTANLVHTTSSTSTPTINATFASLAYGASITNKDNLPTNTWGYSYSNDSGTTWRPYSGLPLYSDTNNSKVLFNTYSPAHNTSLDFKIAANSSNTQPSGEYTNIINFYATSVPEPPLLYDVVQDMTKGTLAENNVKLSDTITQANSGVYTYDPAVYGVASDASNDYPIYFYRGILDTDAGLGTYGSDGQADAWPNYVKLNNNTCWRIVRTTGSGGVKMIYNGTYKNGTCANSGGDTSTGSNRFNIVSDSIVSAGYTFNNNYKTIAEDTSYGVLFGVNKNYVGNSTDSDIKGYLEAWFTGAMSSYEGKLESSAGFCNDRSVYDSSGNLLLDDMNISMPYAATSGVAVYYFGSRQRNETNSQKLSLACPRSIVDLYTVNGASDGNGQLGKPVALLTADEASFAGSGKSVNGGSSYGTSSYLCSGGNFLLLSPRLRWINGSLQIFWLSSQGYLDGNHSGVSYNVRPVISLMHHIQVTSGSGTATSPWTIE